MHGVIVYARCMVYVFKQLVHAPHFHNKSNTEHSFLVVHPSRSFKQKSKLLKKMVKVAVVTGSNKGIGYEIVRGLLQQKFEGDVFLTSRSEERGLEAVEKLNKVRIRN